MTATEKRNIESLHLIISNLQKEEIHMTIIHLNSAVDLLEQRFNKSDYPQANMSKVKYVVEVLARDMRLKTKADRTYYGKLIALAAKELSKIYSVLYNNFHGMG